MLTEARNTKGHQTRESIRQAIVRLEKGRPKVVEKGRKLTITAVAEEAGVSRASIHNRYPDLADRIREHGNKAVREQRDIKQDALKVEKIKNRNLRDELTELRATLARVTSENARLQLINRQLEAISSSKNVSMMPSKNSS